MANPEWRKLMQTKRLEYQLEIQSRQIENVLKKHDISARVAGGHIHPRAIRFDLSAQMGQGLHKLRQIKNELLTVLGITDGDLVQNTNGWQLHISRKDNAPVSLLDLLMITPDLEPMTAVLGFSDAGDPVLCELSEKSTPHILITGEEGAGKSTLLRTIAISLALSHKQSQLQFVVLDGTSEGNYHTSKILEPLSNLPHMICPIAYTNEEYSEMLNFLVGECSYREEQQMHSPNIVILIDEVVSLLRTDSNKRNFEQDIIYLLQRGPAVGLHLILSTCEPGSEKISNSMRLNLPMRLIGKLEDPTQIIAASDIFGTQAEYLLGQGDFLTVMDETVTHFQSAYVSEYDMFMLLEALQRRRPTTLLAQPLNHNQMNYLEENTNSRDQQNTYSFKATSMGIEITT